MGILTKDQIWNVDDRLTKPVPVPEWGGDVLIGVISAVELEQHEQLCREVREGRARPGYSIRASLVALAARNEDGTRMFTEKEVAKLAKKSGPVLDLLYDEAAEFNRITKRSREELAGNSQQTRSDDSGESSPEQ